MESGPLVGRIALNGIEVVFFLVGNKNNNFIFMDVKSRISMLRVFPIDVSLSMRPSVCLSVG